MPLLVSVPCRHDRTFQQSSPDAGEWLRRQSFPMLVRSPRFVALGPRALVPRCGSLPTRQGRGTGRAFVDSPPLAVCHNRRINAHQVFAGWATRGKTATGWCAGLTLHLSVNAAGERLAWCLPPGQVADRTPVPTLSKRQFGPLFGDRGDSAQALPDTLFAHGLALWTKSCNHLKNRLMRLWDQLLRRPRTLLETLNDQLQHISQIEHTRHRRVTGGMVHLGASLVADSYTSHGDSL